MIDEPEASLSRRALLGAGGLLGASGVLPLAALAAQPVVPPAGAKGKLAVQRLAWAGIRLEAGDSAVFIDAIAPDPSQGIPGPALGTKAATRFALVSHAHSDHCDPNALKPVLEGRGYLVAHEDAAREVDARVVAVHRVRIYEPVFLHEFSGDFVAWCVPASDGFGASQVSWVVDGGGRRIIHCGDTGWHGGWWHVARAYGPFDAVFLPINGLRLTAGLFTDLKEPMSLTPEQAANAAVALGAKLVVPIHYGSTGDPSYVEQENALPRFQKAAAARGLAVRVLAPGEIFTL